MEEVEELDVVVRRAQGGEVDAFTELVERFQDMAYGFAFAFLNDFAEAQDVAQEAFIEAYRCLPELRQPLAFPAWFKRILFKHCDRQTRGLRPACEPLEAAGELAAHQAGPEEISEQRELAQTVREAVGTLPLDQRVATTLFYINGYSQQEIADFLEVPAKTIKSRLHTSRLRLKERMVEMIQDDLNANGLSADFTHKTVERAVAQAREMNEANRFKEAEKLLRPLLEQVPGHSGALKALNRAVMRGQVHLGRWDLLPELVEHGREILQTGEDEETRRELAKTLLAIPAMPEAVEFIEHWIVQCGRNLERLGMLAWARGCLGDLAAAERLWEEILQVTGESGSEPLGFICMTLVDCFAAAGDLLRAQEVARQGWSRCSRADQTPDLANLADFKWLHVFLQAGLDYQEVGRVLLARYETGAGLEACGAVLCIRAFLVEPQGLMADWLDWARDCLAAGEGRWLRKFASPVTRALRALGAPDVQMALAQATWELLQDPSDPAPAAAPAGLISLRERWNYERFNFFTYFDRGDWVSMERVAWRGIREWKLDENATGVIVACAALGKSTPEELVRAAAEHGVESVDSYGLFGWYMLGREAAAAGRAEESFAALRRSLGYWSNPPLLCLDQWENDLRWGDLRSRAEFKAIFAEKRQRIGPIYGLLHYFPGW